MSYTILSNSRRARRCNATAAALLLGLSALLGGCSKDTAEPVNPDNADRVEILPQAALGAGSIDATSGDAASKAPVSGSTANLPLWFARADQTSASAYGSYGATALSTTRTAGSGAQALAAFNPVQNYLSSGLKTKLTGWHPQATTFTGGVVTWTIDGSHDVMTAPRQEGDMKTAMPAFTFGHRLTQLQFSVYADDQTVADTWGNVTAITVTGQKNTCTYTLSSSETTGAVVFTGAATNVFTVQHLTAAKAGVGAANAKAMGDPVMIEAQEAATYKLNFTITTVGGGTKTVSIAARAYPAGQAIAVKLRLTRTEITGTAAITAWTWADNAYGDGEQDTDPELLVVNLSKNNTANCYIASEARATYSFKATVMGNGVGTDGVALAAIDPKSAKVFWQTGKVIEDGSVKLENGRVKFTLDADFNPADGGSALIAVYDNADPDATGAKVLWSWHIWATDYNPGEEVNYGLAANSKATVTGGEVHTYGTTYMTTNPGKAIMDRNLGAEKTLYALATGADDNWPTYGLLYQWGRKDPFPGAIINVVLNNAAVRPLYGATGTGTALSFTPEGGSKTIADAVANPGTFYKNPNDWTTQNDNLWNSTTGKKTAYDPCPPGWRVAPDKTWSDFTKDGNFTKAGDWTANHVKGGRLYTAGSVKAWYPASGWRYSDQGGATAYFVGRSEWSWSSSVDGNRSSSLYVDVSSFDSSRAEFRTNGNSVRCIQE